MIWYEDMVADAQAAVDKVASLFGLQGRTLIRKEKVDLQIQRDAVTNDWRARFRHEFRNTDELDIV